MLYNLEPDASVTGGAWYSDQDFESEFVDILNQQCHKFLLQKVRENSKLVFFVSCVIHFSVNFVFVFVFGL